MKRTRLKAKEDQPELFASKTINFRLDESSLRLLHERAEVLGTTPNKLAREFVIEMFLESQYRNCLAAAMMTNLHELRELRLDVALAVHALLMTTGRMSDADAQKWVDANLKPKGSSSTAKGTPPSKPGAAQ